MSYEDTEALIDGIIAFHKPGEEGLSNSSRRAVDIYTPTDLRADVFESYTHAMVKEDYSAALDAVLRFFDFQSPPFAGGASNNRGLRQHALLNLSSFHLHHSEYAIARQTCNEGIKVARQAGDLIALSALTSLLRAVELEVQEQLRKVGGVEGDEALEIEKGSTKEDPGGYTAPMDHLRDIEIGHSNVSLRIRCLACRG